MNKPFSTDKSNIVIDFSLFPFCFRCIKIGKCTNKLQNSNQFFKFFKRIFEVDIPALTQHSFDDVTKATNKHSHAIGSSTKEYSQIINIVKELFKSYKGDNYKEKDFDLFLQNNINDYFVWQLGISGGIRLFGIRKSNVFSVLFIDYHHLVYPDKNNNGQNYELYNFCPITNNNIGGIINE